MVRCRSTAAGASDAAVTAPVGVSRPTGARAVTGSRQATAPRARVPQAGHRPARRVPRAWLPNAENRCAPRPSARRRRRRGRARRPSDEQLPRRTGAVRRSGQLAAPRHRHGRRRARTGSGRTARPPARRRAELRAHNAVSAASSRVPPSGDATTLRTRSWRSRGQQAGVGQVAQAVPARRQAADLHVAARGEVEVAVAEAVREHRPSATEPGGPSAGRRAAGVRAGGPSSAGCSRSAPGQASSRSRMLSPDGEGWAAWRGTQRWPAPPERRPGYARGGGVCRHRTASRRRRTARAQTEEAR